MSGESPEGIGESPERIKAFLNMFKNVPDTLDGIWAREILDYINTLEERLELLDSVARGMLTAFLRPAQNDGEIDAFCDLADTLRYLDGVEEPEEYELVGYVGNQSGKFYPATHPDVSPPEDIPGVWDVTPVYKRGAR